MSAPVLLGLPKELLQKIASLVCANDEKKVRPWMNPMAPALCLVCRALLPFGRQNLYRKIVPPTYPKQLRRYLMRLSRTVEDSAETWDAASLVQEAAIWHIPRIVDEKIYSIFGRCRNILTLHVAVKNIAPKPLCTLIKSFPSLQTFAVQVRPATRQLDYFSLAHMMRIVSPTLVRLRLTISDPCVFLEGIDFPRLLKAELCLVPGADDWRANYAAVLARFGSGLKGFQPAELAIVDPSFGLDNAFALIDDLYTPELSVLDRSTTSIDVHDLTKSYLARAHDSSSCSTVRVLKMHAIWLKPDDLVSIPSSVQYLHLELISTSFLPALADRLEDRAFLPHLDAICVTWYKRTGRPDRKERSAKARAEQACACRGMDHARVRFTMVGALDGYASGMDFYCIQLRGHV